MAVSKTSQNKTLDPYQQALKAAVNNTSTNNVNNLQNTVTKNNTVQSPTKNTIDRINQGTQQQFNFTAPKEFTYDYNTDPLYQSALQSARQNITTQQNNTNAQLRSQGQGKSSFSETLANQIGAKEMGRISNEVIPQLASQAYQRYADQANRNFQVQQANYGVTQDQLNNLNRLYAIQDQEYFQNPMSESALTGSYLSGEARGYIDAINQLKRQAETPGIARDEMLALSSEADNYRKALQGLGVDSSLFGRDVNLNQALANQNKVGTRTLQGQNFDEGIRQYNQKFDYGVQRDNVADEQYRQELQRMLANDANSRSLGWANYNLSKERENRIANQEREALKQATQQLSEPDIYSASTSQNYKYSNDPEFIGSIKTINTGTKKDIDELYEDMMSDPQFYASQFGYSGYEELVKRIEQRRKSFESPSGLNLLNGLNSTR